jgi:phytoene synthase
LAPVFDHRIAQVVDRLLVAADELYDRSEHGIGQLPWDCRPAIAAARLVYAEIGCELRRGGLDSVNQRAVVSGRRKLTLLARASGAALRPPADPGLHMATLPANRFLVDAASIQSAVTPTHSIQRRSLDERLQWTAELFERLAREDQKETSSAQVDEVSTRQ